MRIIFGLIAAISFTTFQHFFFNNGVLLNRNSQSGADSVLTASLCFAGDLMCHSTQFNYAKVGADSFNFTGVFREVKQFLSEPDLTIGNLETVIAGKNVGYSGYPYFNAPDDFVFALKNTGFDLLITANNHALDQGWEGVKRTIGVLNDYKIHRTGTFTSEEDQDSIRIFQVNSIKIAILAYSENTNGVPVPKGKDFIIALIDEERIKADIQRVREKDVDLVLVHLHYGSEYEREPGEYQKQIVKKIIEFGADIIVGGHPHVIQPFDFFKTKNTKLDSGFIAYSMGNFISNQRWRYSDAGLILNIEIAKNRFSDSIYINNVNYIPTWVFKGLTELGREYIILPSQLYEDSTLYFLTASDRELMKEAFYDTKEIVTRYSKKPNLYSIQKDEKISLSDSADISDSNSH